MNETKIPFFQLLVCVSIFYLVMAHLSLWFFHSAEIEYLRSQIHQQEIDIRVLEARR